LKARIECLTDHFHRQTVGVSINSKQGNIIRADVIEGTYK